MPRPSVGVLYGGWPRNSGKVTELARCLFFSFADEVVVFLGRKLHGGIKF